MSDSASSSGSSSYDSSPAPSPRDEHDEHESPGPKIGGISAKSPDVQMEKNALQEELLGKDVLVTFVLPGGEKTAVQTFKQGQMVSDMKFWLSQHHSIPFGAKLHLDTESAPLMFDPLSLSDFPALNDGATHDIFVEV